MPITLEAATALVLAHLEKERVEANEFGSALPDWRPNRISALVISLVDEHDFGWVFHYTSAEYLRTGDFEHQLVGNAPLLVERETGRMYDTGTAYPVEHYIDGYRKGLLRPCS